MTRRRLGRPFQGVCLPWVLARFLSLAKTQNDVHEEDDLSQEHNDQGHRGEYSEILVFRRGEFGKMLMVVYSAVLTAHAQNEERYEYTIEGYDG